MLSQRWLVNLVLVILIAGLIVTATIFERDPVEESTPAISPLSREAISTLGIEYGDLDIDLVRTDSGWRIDAPIRWPANAANLQRILSVLEIEAAPLAQAGDVDLAALGLAQPVARLQFDDTEMHFGAINNIGGRRYLMIDNRIYLMADVHLAFIAQGLPGLVERSLLPPPFAIQSLTLPGIAIERLQDDSWRSSPATYSNEGIRDLVDNWQGLQASRIQAFNLQGSAREVIEVQLQDGRRLDFLLMATEPELILANPEIDLQYHFLRDFAEQLLTLPVPADAS